ncbi:hypothetical protein CRUP_034161 [Coryphaenoides rupestris]|nr:hypothetical protein CRUP_034161 [Coryphaenoides rupestris]
MTSLLSVFVLIVIVQCTRALDLLPAPVNVTMLSVNFRHELTWDPGPGTPPGTHYTVFVRKNKKERKRSSNTTRCGLKLANLSTFDISVQAVYNSSLPELSLVGGDHRLELNITLPKMHNAANIADIQKYYYFNYRIEWKAVGDGGKTMSIDTMNSSVVLDRLMAGMEYCMRSLQFYGSRFLSSPWLCWAWWCSVSHCTILASWMSFIHSYLLTPETTIPERVYLHPEADKQKRRNAHPQSAVEGPRLKDEDKDEDEDEDDADRGKVGYINRAGELSSDSESQDAPGDSSGISSKGARPMVDSGEVPVVESPLPVSHDQPEVRGPSIDWPVMLDGAQHRTVGSAVSRCERDEGRVSVDVPRGEVEDVNLFSVTLAKGNSGNINLCSVIFGKKKETADNEPDVEYDLYSHGREPHRMLGSTASLSATPSDTQVVLPPAFLDPGQCHIPPSQAAREAFQPSPAAFTSGFKPITDGELALPQLTLSACDQFLCVDIQPHMETLRHVYQQFNYRLRVTSRTGGQTVEFEVNGPLGRHVLRDLAPGREYCVSVCIFDTLAPRRSVYSQPQCTSTTSTGIYAEDVFTSVILCLLAVLILGTVFLLERTGVVCLNNLMPSVLRSGHVNPHMCPRLALPPPLHHLSCDRDQRFTAPHSAAAVAAIVAETEAEGCNDVNLLSLTFGGRGEGWAPRATPPPTATEDEVAMETVVSVEDEDEEVDEEGPGGYLRR